MTGEGISKNDERRPGGVLKSRAQARMLELDHRGVHSSSL
jgi:hypothetical protein